LVDSPLKLSHMAAGQRGFHDLIIALIITLCCYPLIITIFDVYLTYFDGRGVSDVYIQRTFDTYFIHISYIFHTYFIHV
jgi:hypothetical protein